MQKLKLLALALFAASLQAPALAEDDHKGHDHGTEAGGHAHDTKPAHGGVVSVVKDVNYELVAAADSLTLYIADHGKPVDLKGASAKVTVLSGTDKSEATLAAAGDRLEAKGSFKVAAGAKVLAQVTTGSGAPVSVRFVLK